jgi:SOS response associated peptidase (SRAP)
MKVLFDKLKFGRELILMGDTGSDEKTYTFTIITTDSNKQLNFLHDRMPVILEPGSEALRTWLDPNRYEWTNELQSLLKPFGGELECYPVNKDVGKVGNNSPSFIIPIDSSENKNNIANFFGNQAKLAKAQKDIKHEGDLDTEGPLSKVEKLEDTSAQSSPNEVKLELDAAGDVENSESNAPLPTKPPAPKRTHDETLKEEEDQTMGSPIKAPKLSQGSAASNTTPSKTGRKVRSAISNGTVPKSSPSKAARESPAKGSQKITNFFSKKAS